MKKIYIFAALILLSFILTACKNNEMPLNKSPNVVEGVLVRSINVYHDYDLLRKIELYNTCKIHAKEILEHSIYFDRYLIKPNEEYLCYKLYINDKEIEILNAFVNGFIDIDDIDRLGLPVSLVEEYPYPVHVYEKVNTRYQIVDGIETKYVLWATYKPGYVTADIFIYETELFIYGYPTTNIVYKINMNGNEYTLNEIFEKVKQGEVDIDFLIRLGIPITVAYRN